MTTKIIEEKGKRSEASRNTAEHWYDKGLFLAMDGKHQVAITCYNKAIEINSKWADPWYSKGRSLQELEKYEEASICYEKVLEMDQTQFLKIHYAKIRVANERNASSR